jgi:hypothetical protein
MSTHELERNVRRAYRLGRKWLSSDLTVRSSFVFDAAASTRVTDVCILPDRDGKWLLTVAKGVWSVIRIWDTSQGVKLLMEWCPRGALIQGCAFNSDSTSENALAVSVVQDKSVTCPGNVWTRSFTRLRLTALGVSTSCPCEGGTLQNPLSTSSHPWKSPDVLR